MQINYIQKKEVKIPTQNLPVGTIFNSGAENWYIKIEDGCICLQTGEFYNEPAGEALVIAKKGDILEFTL